MRVQEARTRNSVAPKRELTPSGKRRASAEDRQKERRKKAKSWYRPSCCLSCCPRSCAPRGGRLLGVIEKMATHPHRAGFRFKERSRWAFEDPNIGKYLAVMFPDAIAASEVRGRIVFHTSTRNVTRVAVFFFHAASPGRHFPHQEQQRQGSIPQQEVVQSAIQMCGALQRFLGSIPRAVRVWMPTPCMIMRRRVIIYATTRVHAGLFTR